MKKNITSFVLLSSLFVSPLFANPDNSLESVGIKLPKSSCFQENLICSVEDSPLAYYQKFSPGCTPCYVPPRCIDYTTRSDNIPADHVVLSNDEYLTGYVQALIDTNYYEYEVQVVVCDHVAYLFYLPCNQLVAQSIACYVRDIPGVCDVRRIDVGYEQYVDQTSCCETVCEPVCPPPCCSPCRQINGIWFPQSTVLFAPFIADPRCVTNSAAFRVNDDVVGKHVGAVSFGDQFIFFRWFDVFWWRGDLEVGIEAGIFSVFDLDHTEACMVNTDFFVAALFDYAINKWAWRFRIWHLSSHIGDEFLISNPEFDRCNLSDEGVDLFVSYQITPAIRLYFGGGDIFDRDDEFPEKPIYFEGGVEIRIFGCRNFCHKLYFQPFLAMDFRSWQEHDWDIDQTYALGAEWSKLQGIGRKIRLFVEYHQGYSFEGQFLRERTDYTAIRFTYGF